MTPGASKVTSDQGPKPACTVTAWDRTPGASSTGFSSKKALVLDFLNNSIRRARVRPPLQRGDPAGRGHGPALAYLFWARAVTVGPVQCSR